jgi:hypothetical protein
MDQGRFDSLTRSLATGKTRRGFLGGLVALASGVRAASAQTACPTGQTRDRKGECHCPPGTDACSDGCFDKKHDPNHCGACGTVCLSGEVCQKGECTCPRGATCCPPGLTNCNDACVDLETDVDHCSACNTLCAQGDDCTTVECEAGVCKFTFLIGNACTTPAGLAGICNVGVCVANPPLPLGTVCTAADTCDQTGGATACADNSCAADGGPFNCCRLLEQPCTDTCDCCGGEDIGCLEQSGGNRICQPYPN